MFKQQSHLKHVPALLALSSLIYLSPIAYAQSAPAQTSEPSRDLDQNTNRDTDITRQELARFDQFLDSHREIAEQLRKNPSLVNDRNFVQQHQALQTYLQQHPGIREEITENPNAFMLQEQRFDRREDARDDITRRELASFDRFLASHREIGEQLHKNPSLVNNEEYTEKHPELQAYLQQHPGVREEITENPNTFMRQEERFDSRQDARDRRDDDRNGNRNADRDVARNEDRDRFGNRDGNRDIDRDDRISGQPVRDRDTTRGELASFDQFLDRHREIAEQLRKNPGLVNNQQFLADHPALQTYLTAHKNVREEIDENPQAFMHQEARYDRHEDGQRNEWDRERAGFGEFLHSHAAISEQLSKNPSLVKNQEFMATHPELQEYLKAHPAAQTQLTQNPETFIKSAQQLNATTKSSISTNTTGSVKTTPPDATKPPKQ
jgi:hypothetical protein